MTQQYTPNLGQLAGPSARRDAVHVAVAPVVAAQDLDPGAHVGIRDDGKAYWCDPFAPPTVGVVDPFLTRRVKEGERFWIFLYPGTVTSLRHVWTHPAFVARVPAEAP